MNTCHCPLCASALKFQGAGNLILCANCGWQILLSPQEKSDLVDALLGFADFNLDAFMQQLALQAVVA